MLLSVTITHFYSVLSVQPVLLFELLSQQEFYRVAKQNLVISAIGTEQRGIVRMITQCIVENDCNLLDSHMTIMGEEFSMISLVAGNWNTLTRLEKDLADLGKTHDLSIQSRRTGDAKPAPSLIPYMVEINAIDRAGIMYELTQFFTEQNINMAELSTSHYLAPGTQAQMFSANVTIHVDAQSSLSNLRDAFNDFCEEKNFEAFLEPKRN